MRRTAAHLAIDPNFARLARVYGARGVATGLETEVGPEMNAAFAHDQPVMIDVRSRLDHISAYTTLAQLGAAAS